MAVRVFTMLLLVLGACPEWAQSQPASQNSEPSAAPEITLEGAGSTVINPLMQRWAKEYHRLHPEVQVRYQSIGSRGGIRVIMKGQATFGATEVPMSDGELAVAKDRVLHFPISLRAVVPSYNLPQVPELHLSGNTLAKIFLGKITSWDDPAIAVDNPGVNLPKMEIHVVHRFPQRDGGWATFEAAHYLSGISTEFRDTYEKSDGRSWPVPTGMRCAGECSVAAAVHDFPGSIGWVDFWMIGLEHLQTAAVKNSDGEFVKAAPESVTAAAAAGIPVMQTKAQDFRLSLTNEAGKSAYPVSAFVWMILYDDNKDKKQHQAMIDFLKWVLTEGQKIAPKLDYAPLPPELVELELKRIKF